jgi:hypothetical protein
MLQKWEQEENKIMFHASKIPQVLEKFQCSTLVVLLTDKSLDNCSVG